MILNESEVTERFESPLNLLNRLKSGINHKSERSNIISLPPTSSEVIENLEDKLQQGGLKSKAAAIMNMCLDELKERVVEVQRPEKLAAIAVEMNKVISAQEDKKDELTAPRYVIYAPTFSNEENYETVVIKE